ncbi:MAG: hypothetical protein KBI01_10195 [Oscillospiraceae bacterium]|jgi:hypothetical protein|nr:hypothetical protein [Oscillospiraceae bacterium]
MNKNIGFYMETEPRVLVQDNMIITAFRDRAVYKNENGYHTERQMTVDGKNFYVRSFFPSISKTTPTDQLIKLIDNDSKMK